jgi:hypothetical protein
VYRADVRHAARVKQRITMLPLGSGTIVNPKRSLPAGPLIATCAASTAGGSAQAAHTINRTHLFIAHPLNVNRSPCYADFCRGLRHDAHYRLSMFSRRTEPSR